MAMCDRNIAVSSAGQWGSLEELRGETGVAILVQRHL